VKYDFNDVNHLAEQFLAAYQAQVDKEEAARLRLAEAEAAADHDRYDVTVEEYASAPTKFVLMNVDGRFFAGLTPSGRAVWAGIVYAKVVDGNFQSGVKLDAVALPAPWYLINGVN